MKISFSVNIERFVIDDNIIMMQMYMNKMLNSLQQQESDLDTREAADVALNVARFRSAL